MKTISIFAALSALCAAAFAAILFPEMKSILLVIPFALTLLALGGCSSANFEARVRKLPDGHFDSVRLTETGKFTSTTIEGANLTKDGNTIHADKVRAQHTNPWLPNVEFIAEGWTLDVSANARPKKPEPARPLSAEPAKATEPEPTH